MLSNCSQCKYFDPNPHHSNDIRCSIAPAYATAWTRLKDVDEISLQTLPISSCLDFDLNESLQEKEISLALTLYQWQKLIRYYDEDRIIARSFDDKLFEHSLSLSLQRWQAIANSTNSNALLEALAEAGIEPEQKWIEVNSSCIEAIAFLRSESLLLVKFHSQDIYEYSEVDYQTFESFIDSASKGIFFNRYIKDQYSFNLSDRSIG